MALNKTLLGVLLTALAFAPALAQAPVTGVADPESLFTSPDPKLNANKQVVLHIVRDLLEANHWELADKYLMWRIKDGKADEHWDGATIAAPPAAR